MEELVAEEDDMMWTEGYLTIDVKSDDSDKGSDTKEIKYSYYVCSFENAEAGSTSGATCGDEILIDLDEIDQAGDCSDFVDVKDELEDFEEESS